MKFRYTILYVADVPAAMGFFETAFGFERGFLHEGQDYGELVTGDTKLAFSARALMEQLGRTPVQPRPDAPTFQLSFEVEDVQAAFDRAIGAGAVSVQEPRQEPWGQTTSAVSDPEGFIIELCSPVGG